MYCLSLLALSLLSVGSSRSDQVFFHSNRVPILDDIILFQRQNVIKSTEGGQIQFKHSV